MRNIKLTIEYDGTLFHGWQVQVRGQRTVQGEIEKALTTIFKHPVTLTGSGRTDSGVHALGQVANFQINSPMPTAEIIRAVNANINPDITILAATEVPLSFHSQYSAKRKTYRYTILNRAVRPCQQRLFVLHVPYTLNIYAMRKAAKILKGRHDFRSFKAADPANPNDTAKNTLRTISRISIKKQGDLVSIAVEANGFLYKMVRNIIGTLLAVGQGRLTANEVKKILRAKNRAQASATAPSHGLCLVKVTYGKIICSRTRTNLTDQK